MRSKARHGPRRAVSSSKTGTASHLRSACQRNSAIRVRSCVSFRPGLMAEVHGARLWLSRVRPWRAWPFCNITLLRFFAFYGGRDAHVEGTSKLGHPRHGECGLRQSPGRDVQPRLHCAGVLPRNVLGFKPQMRDVSVALHSDHDWHAGLLRGQAATLTPCFSTTFLSSPLAGQATTW